MSDSAKSKALKPRDALAAAAVTILLLPACTTLQGGTSPQFAALPASAAEADASTKAKLRLAESAMKAANYAAAVRLYEALQKAHPDDPGLAFGRGRALFEMGMLEEARRVLGDAAQRFPDHAEVGLLYARVLLVLGKDADGLAQYDRLLERGSSVPALLGRGVALDYLGRHREAQQQYRQILATDEDHYAARNNLALSLALSGRFEDAVSILEPLANGPTSSARTRQNLAFIYGLSGNAERARAFNRLDMPEAEATMNGSFYDTVRQGLSPSAPNQSIEDAAPEGPVPLTPLPTVRPEGMP